MGFRNVRIMFETRKQAQVLREIKESKLHILGISNGQVLPYTPAEKTKTPGVVIILSKSATKSLIEYNPVNERIITARLNTKPIKISIIQNYSPTNEVDKAMQSEFYEILQTEIEKTPQKDLTIIMGDFNTKVGHDYSGFERTMGKHGCGMNNKRKGGISSRLL